MSELATHSLFRGTNKPRGAAHNTQGFTRPLDEPYLPIAEAPFPRSTFGNWVLARRRRRWAAGLLAAVGIAAAIPVGGHQTDPTIAKSTIAASAEPSAPKAHASAAAAAPSKANSQSTDAYPCRPIYGLIGKPSSDPNVTDFSTISPATDALAAAEAQALQTSSPNLVSCAPPDPASIGAVITDMEVMNTRTRERLVVSVEPGALNALGWPQETDWLKAEAGGPQNIAPIHNVNHDPTGEHTWVGTVASFYGVNGAREEVAAYVGVLDWKDQRSQIWEVSAGIYNDKGYNDNLAAHNITNYTVITFLNQVMPIAVPASAPLPSSN